MDGAASVTSDCAITLQPLKLFHYNSVTTKTQNTPEFKARVENKAEKSLIEHIALQLWAFQQSLIFFSAEISYGVPSLGVGLFGGI